MASDAFPGAANEDGQCVKDLSQSEGDPVSVNLNYFSSDVCITNKPGGRFKKRFKSISSTLYPRNVTFFPMGFFA